MTRAEFWQDTARRGHRLKGGLCPCCACLIRRKRRRCRFARAAARSCGSLKKRRELAICLTFVPLNAEPVARRRSRQREVEGIVERWPTRQHANRRRNRTNNLNYGVGTFTITTANMSSPLCSIGPRQSFEHRPRHVRFSYQ
jgi:hypothetical protein